MIPLRVSKTLEHVWRLRPRALNLIEHAWNYLKRFYNVSTIHRGQEIELQSWVSLYQKGRGGKNSSKKEMKIHLICENFRNWVKSCPLALFPYLILENHRDWACIYQDSRLFFLYSSLFILKWSLAAVVQSPDERESPWDTEEVEQGPL